MFFEADHINGSTLRPDTSQITPSDWDLLASMYHPVAFCDEIKDEPRSFLLLDVPLVLFRTADGITVAKDICPHRGAPLSLGCIKNNHIECPYHGMQFSPDGLCVRIPSREDDKEPIPKSFGLEIFASVERYGLLWVCLGGNPLLPLPEWPILEREAIMRSPGTTITRNAEVWEASAPRHVENFNDPGHISFIHANSFGDPNNPAIPKFDVDRSTAHVLKREKKSKTAVDGIERSFTLLSELTLPFSSLLVDLDDKGPLRYALHDVAAPNSAYQCTLFQIAISECGDARAQPDYVQQVNAEDKAIIERLSPKSFSLNVRSERHTQADKCGIVYRKALIELGLGAAST